jgi:hypothetical protein
MNVPARAAVVHVEGSHPQGSLLHRPLLDGEWPLREKSAATRAAFLASLQLLLPVAYRNLSGRRQLTVLEARRIVGHRIGADGRVTFTTVAAPEWAHLVNGPSPASWAPGEGWPVKVVDLPATGRSSVTVAA